MSDRPTLPWIENDDRREQLRNRIDRDFSHCEPTPADVMGMMSLRKTAHVLATQISELVPMGREQSTALTRLEETIMHANAGIARLGK